MLFETSHESPEYNPVFEDCHTVFIELTMFCYKSSFLVENCVPYEIDETFE